jgi:hypothetical protein
MACFTPLFQTIRHSRVISLRQLSTKFEDMIKVSQVCTIPDFSFQAYHICIKMFPIVMCLLPPQKSAVSSNDIKPLSESEVTFEIGFKISNLMSTCYYILSLCSAMLFVCYIMLTLLHLAHTYITNIRYTHRSSIWQN